MIFYIMKNGSCTPKKEFPELMLVYGSKFLWICLIDTKVDSMGVDSSLGWSFCL